MELIMPKQDLKTNLLTLERYMSSNNSVEKIFHRELIKLGIDFVVYKKNNKYVFAPSRFIGYKNNNMNAHINNEYKNGGKTTPRINEILGFECKSNISMDNEYRGFCKSLNFEAREKGTCG